MLDPTSAKGALCNAYNTTNTQKSVDYSCNPDFNIAQAGIITRWTPVKNLTFSGDFAWTRVDQKYAGTVVAPTLAAVAKPAAVYELKDQDSYNFLLRAQRNF